MKSFFLVVLYVILGILAFMLAYWCLIMVSSIFVDTAREYETNSLYCRFLINSSTFFVCILAHIHLHVTGMEKVPENTRFELVGNHTSKFDPILQWYVFRKYDVAFLSKEANFHVPFYGRLIRKCCFWEIDRENPVNAARTLKKCEGLIKRDECCVGVYPEGTRGDGSALLPFHNGVFYVAKNTGVPIVVVATKGTLDIHKNFPFKRTDVYMEVTDVIPADYLKAHRTTEIGERVRESLDNKLYKGEN